MVAIREGSEVTAELVERGGRVVCRRPCLHLARSQRLVSGLSRRASYHAVFDLLIVALRHWTLRRRSSP